MNRERFIRQRRTDWQLFEHLTGRLKNTRVARWKSQEIVDLSRLYRSICYDLSLVQSREWGTRLEQYLNDLVAQGHNCLYRSPPRSVTLVSDFVNSGFPRLLRQRKWSFLLSLALFAGPFLVCALIAVWRPELAELVVGKESLDSAVQSYSAEHYSGVNEQYAGERSTMAGFYIWNNVGIAFKAFALGVFLGIGTAIVLLSNGISIGMMFGHMATQTSPVSDNFFSFVITHGAFELTAIVISGAGGLVLGQGMLFPGTMNRLDSLRHHGREALQLALGAGIMLLIAAMIEGFFSPMPIPSIIKYVVGSLMWLLVGMYMAFAGRESDSRTAGQKLQDVRLGSAIPGSPAGEVAR